MICYFFNQMNYLVSQTSKEQITWRSFFGHLCSPQTLEDQKLTFFYYKGDSPGGIVNLLMWVITLIQQSEMIPKEHLH